MPCHSRPTDLVQRHCHTLDSSMFSITVSAAHWTAVWSCPDFCLTTVLSFDLQMSRFAVCCVLVAVAISSGESPSITVSWSVKGTAGCRMLARRPQRHVTCGMNPAEPHRRTSVGHRCLLPGTRSLKLLLVQERSQASASRRLPRRLCHHPTLQVQRNHPQVSSCLLCVDAELDRASRAAVVCTESDAVFALIRVTIYWSLARRRPSSDLRKCRWRRSPRRPRASRERSPQIC